MRKLTIIPYLLLWLLLLLFAVRNWEIVQLNLWGDLHLIARIPVLLALALILGALPFWLQARLSRASARRRIARLERALADAESRAAAATQSGAEAAAPSVPAQTGA